MKKLIPPYLFVLCLFAMALLRWWVPGVLLGWSIPLAILGLLLVVFGLGLAKRAANLFRRRAVDLNTFAPPAVLVTNDVFRYSRNPMYVGFAIALSGAALLLGNTTALPVVAFFVVVTDRWYIRFEEAAMQRVFGPHYADYRSKTRRWL